MLIYFTAALVLTFFVTVIAARILIPKLKSIKMGVKILEIGPRWHKSKEGTPTMGGLTFIIGMVVTFLTVGIFAILFAEDIYPIKIILTLGLALCGGVIGSIDDYAKFTKKENKGLNARQKYLLQLIVAGAYLFGMTACGFLTTELYIPFLGFYLKLSWLYYVFALLLITGIMNSVNLTDGIDGLSSTVTFVVGIFFTIAAFTLADLSTALLSAMLIGACLGFLVYNFYPAKLFMGDTGSLFLGGFVVGLAFMIDNPLIIVVAGFIYVCESLSVMMQVTYFKLTHGKRIFKMSPIHHHFELCGWKELKIVGVFSLVTVIMCVIAYFGV